MDAFFDSITRWLTSIGGITVIITLCITLLSRIFMTIFRQAIAFKNTLMSKQEWTVERKHLIDEFNSLKESLKQDLLTILLAEIKLNLKDFDDIKAIVSKNINIDKVIDEKIKQLKDRFSKQDQLEAKLVYLERRLNNYEHGSLTDDPMRRSGK